MTVVHSEPSFHLATPELDLDITARGGHLAPAVFHLPGREVSPYALAPWKPDEFPEIPSLLAVLRGDFLCFPFGGQTNGPPHGETANCAWTQIDSDSRSLRLRMETTDTGATVIKSITTREGHHAIYFEHQISGADGDFSYGNHPILDFSGLSEGAGRVTTSAFHWASVFPGPFSDSANGETQALAEGAVFTDLREVQLAAGGTSDLTRYPSRVGNDDLVMVAHRPASDEQPFAWSAAVLDGYVWFSLKNPADFPGTNLWFSNGGRTAPPWNGRHIGRVGIEDVCSHFSDGVDKSRQSLLAKQGVATTRNFRKDQVVTLRNIHAVAIVADDFGAVCSIVPAGESAVAITGESGVKIVVPLEWRFVTNPAFAATSPELSRIPPTRFPMSIPLTTADLSTTSKNLKALIDGHLEDTGGLLRLSPTWVPRSFLQPGLRIKLHPDDTYAYGLNRGGIDERWFGSTTVTANEGRADDEGLSYVIVGNERFTLRDAIAESGAAIIGNALWDKYGKWPVYSKFFDNMGPIPHHMHQSAEQAALVGQEGKPESYYFPPQHNNVGNNFPYTFMGFEPGTTRDQVRKCIANWNKGENGILDLSKAYRLKVGTGWLIDPCILHAPGSLCTYEPQWGSDVFGMYQNLVEGREVPWSLLVKDMPVDKHQDIDFIIDQLDWEKNVDPNFKDNHYLEPVTASKGEGYHDKWIVYGKVDGFQYFTAKEITVEPGATVTIKDNGAYSLIVVQGEGQANKLRLNCPKLLRFNELSNDEFFCTESAAREGVTFQNNSLTEPLVALRYFGPEVNPDAPAMGAYKTQ